MIEKITYEDILELFNNTMGIKFDDCDMFEELGLESISKIIFFSNLEKKYSFEFTEEQLMEINYYGTLREMCESVLRAIGGNSNC